MKHILYIVFIAIIGINSLQAQPATQNKWDRIDALKYEFVLKKLNLSGSTKDQFLPIYKSYQKELRSLYQARKKHRETNKNNPEKQVDDDFNMEAKQLDLKMKYRKQFDRVLSPTELTTLYGAERQFREELINQLNHKKYPKE